MVIKIFKSVTNEEQLNTEVLFFHGQISVEYLLCTNDWAGSGEITVISVNVISALREFIIYLWRQKKEQIGVILTIIMSAIS